MVDRVVQQRWTMSAAAAVVSERTCSTWIARSDRAGTRRKTVGRDDVHVAIDDCTRLAYAEVLGDDNATTAAACLGRAIECFARHGVIVDAIACRLHNIRHLRTRTYRPQTNEQRHKAAKNTSASVANAPGGVLNLAYSRF